MKKRKLFWQKSIVYCVICIALMLCTTNAVAQETNEWFVSITGVKLFGDAQIYGNVVLCFVDPRSVNAPPTDKMAARLWETVPSSTGEYISCLWAKKTWDEPNQILPAVKYLSDDGKTPVVARFYVRIKEHDAGAFDADDNFNTIVGADETTAAMFTRTELPGKVLPPCFNATADGMSDTWRPIDFPLSEWCREGGNKTKIAIYENGELASGSVEFNLTFTLRKKRPVDNSLSAAAIHAGQAFTTLNKENSYVAENAGRNSGNVSTSTNKRAYFGNGYFAAGTKNGAFYYSSSLQGADNRTAIWGKIMDKWNSHEREHGDMGWPVQSNTPTPKKRGEFAHFQKGSIYYSLRTGAHVVWGMVQSKWAAMGWENSSLGFPTSDEIVVTDNISHKRIGVYQDFEGGRLYYKDGSPEAHEMHGEILPYFDNISSKEFPASDQKDVSGGSMVSFNEFTIVKKTGADAHAIYNNIYEVWQRLGGAAGKLGFPTRDAGSSSDGSIDDMIQMQEFEGGVILGTTPYYNDNKKIISIKQRFKVSGVQLRAGGLVN